MPVVTRDGHFAEGGTVRALLRVFRFFFLSVFIAGPAFAQLGGQQVRGEIGLNAGTQASPGIYVAETLYFYRPTEVTGQNGAPVINNISLKLFAPVLGVNFVSKKKIFGAHYGAAVAVWIMNQKLALPSLNVSTSTYGIGDTYVA
jgi:hypothetical protein